jgi:hypothetical protein
MNAERLVARLLETEDSDLMAYAASTLNPTDHYQFGAGSDLANDPDEEGPAYTFKDYQLKSSRVTVHAMVFVYEPQQGITPIKIMIGDTPQYGGKIPKHYAHYRGRLPPSRAATAIRRLHALFSAGVWSTEVRDKMLALIEGHWYSDKEEPVQFNDGSTSSMTKE